MRKPRGILILDENSLKLVYGPEELRQLNELVEFVSLPQTRVSIAENPELLADVDVMFSGWGAPHLDEQFLDLAPNLKVIFYAAGAIGSFVTEAVWHRGIHITSAYEANAIPVAEYALAMTLLSLKQAFRLVRETRELQTFVPRDDAQGNYGSVVGLVSMGATARKFRSLLKPFDLSVQVYDPFLSEAEATLLNVKCVSLAKLFATSDVVSIHAPDLPETEGLITGELLLSMKRAATFINTSRGAVVREREMIQVLKARPDLQAILDVSQPEPPLADSPLYSLPNVILTPHIAGSAGTECRRLGHTMIAELKRYLQGEPLRHVITSDIAKRSSHRPIVASVSPLAKAADRNRVSKSARDPAKAVLP